MLAAYRIQYKTLLELKKNISQIYRTDLPKNHTVTLTDSLAVCSKFKILFSYIIH